MQIKHVVSLAIAACALVSTSFAMAACGPQDKLPEDQRQNHRLHWETKSEVESAGFNIFRSEQSDAGFVKVNKEPIPSAKWSARVRQYEYIDRTIDPCKSYFYYIDGMTSGGESMRVSETMHAGPKEPSAKAAVDKH
jgi:hypothetical protein